MAAVCVESICTDAVPSTACKLVTTDTITAASEADVCRWWLKGKCLYGTQCIKAHPAHLFATQTPQIVRKQHLRENNERNKLKTKGSKKHWGKKKRSKKECIFRYWLLDNFGRDLLGKSSKYGILDIAGGKGILSFEFINLNGIKSTVCDPRQRLSLERQIRGLKKGYLHKNKRIGAQYVDCSLQQCLERSDQQIYPEHLRLFFDEKLIRMMDDEEEEEEDGSKESMEKLVVYQLKQFKKFMKINKEDIVDLSLLNRHKMDHNEGGEENKEWSEQEIDDMVKERIRRDAVRMIEVMKHCNVVIGMHPDYATEFIVDFALKMDIPFAVMPCCVFNKSFPNRRLKNGKAVKQYDDFCTYLTEKHEGIKKESLTLMYGQNTVIYWIPPRCRRSKVKQEYSLCQII